jgi:anthranilate phosphoribosyltransferase
MAPDLQPKPKAVGLFSSGITNLARRSSDYQLVLDPIPESFARMQYFLREIGQGPKGKRDLSREEAREALGMILRDEVAASQAGGFLLLQRFKGESPEELFGFTEATRDGANLIRPNVSGLLDVGSPYDGRKRSIVVSPVSSIVAAAAGVPVVMHGEKGLGPKHGVPVGDVLEALGVGVDGAPEATARSIEVHGFGYLRSARFVPRVYAIRELREEIALRSCLNTVEKIYNLADADYSLIGLTHLPYMQKMMTAATNMGFKRILIVQGIEGNEDVPTSRPCRAFLWDRGNGNGETGGEEEGRGKEEEGAGMAGAVEMRIDASEYGLQAATREEMAGGDAAENAAIARRVLEGEPGGHRDLVLLNAGVRIWLAERAASIADGVAMAREAVDSGAALAKLETLRAA